MQSSHFSVFTPEGLFTRVAIYNEINFISAYSETWIVYLSELDSLWGSGGLNAYSKSWPPESSSPQNVSQAPLPPAAPRPTRRWRPENTRTPSSSQSPQSPGTMRQSIAPILPSRRVIEIILIPWQTCIRLGVATLNLNTVLVKLKTFWFIHDLGFHWIPLTLDISLLVIISEGQDRINIAE